jgi:hypothetical protein
MTGMVQPDLGAKYKEDIDVSIAILYLFLSFFLSFFISLLRYRICEMFSTSISFRLSLFDPFPYVGELNA